MRAGQFQFQGASSFLFLSGFFTGCCGFLCLFFCGMTVQINSKMFKSRNPTEHGFRLENQVGGIIQTLDDGYNLIRFNHLKIKGLRRVNGIKKIAMVSLEWYVHETDFKKI